MHAAAFPLALSRTTLPASLVALVAGAALTAGVISVADSDQLANGSTKVIVVEAPGQGVAAKNEAGVASAIAVGPELRGSKASAIKSSGSTLSQR
jgi:urocanate hydratase